ncbi:MAG: HlyC/CorC family transporter [Lachnospiraceae bacterium]|nr:HlyC/CorC family transporter [Lachnospiraceae bacterium]
MDPSDAIQVLVLLALIGLSAFFSSAETALVTVNKIRIRNLIDEGDRRALILSKLVEDQGKMLSAILIGNNIVNISASSLSTILVTRWLAGTGLAAFAAGISTGVLTLTVLVFGEITPKTCATIHSEKIALSYARIVYTWMIVATPLIYVMNNLSMGILFLMRVDPNDKSETYTEEEIRTIVEVSHEDGIIEPEERKMINNVFDFGDATARDVMVPKVDMSFLNVTATYNDMLDLYKENKYTRYPVYEETTDNVIGMINVKDLLIYEDKEHFDARNIMREVLYTHEHKKTSDIMLEMKQSSTNLAIVLDEYGVTSGMVTMEDLLEEIIGDIRDEYDEDEETLVTQISEREFVVAGAMGLDDLNDYLELDEKGLRLESEDYNSIGGIIIGLLDHLPEVGEEAVTENGIRLVADSVEKNRINEVHIFLPEPDAEETPEED